MEANKNKIRRTTVWIGDLQREEIKANMNVVNASNESEYIRMAVDFFSGYIKSGKAETYLLNTFSSVIHSTIDLSEERIMNMIYKLAVEVAMQNRIIAVNNDVSELDVERIRKIAVDEVSGL